METHFFLLQAVKEMIFLINVDLQYRFYLPIYTYNSKYELKLKKKKECIIKEKKMRKVSMLVESPCIVIHALHVFVF